MFVSTENKLKLYINIRNDAVLLRSKWIESMWRQHNLHKQKIAHKCVRTERKNGRQREKGKETNIRKIKWNAKTKHTHTHTDTYRHMKNSTHPNKIEKDSEYSQSIHWKSEMQPNQVQITTDIPSVWSISQLQLWFYVRLSFTQQERERERANICTNVKVYMREFGKCAF